MKRIVIEISELNDDNWRLIYQLIEICHGRRSDIGCVLTKLQEISTICFQPVPNEKEDPHFASGMALTEELLVRELKSTVPIAVSIVYDKQDDSADFSVLMPFILWIEHSDYSEKGDVTLGVNITQMTNKDEYIFKFGKLLTFIHLPEPSIGIRSLYYIDWTGESKKRKKSVKFPNTQKRAIKKGQSGSGRFLAILKIEPDILALFNNPRDLSADNNNNGAYETQKWIKKSIQILDKHLLQIDPLHKDTFNSLFEEWFIKAFLYSKFEDEIKTIEIGQDEYQSLKSTLHVYCNNIFELTQNVIFHADEKKGLLMIVFNKKQNIAPFLRNKIPGIGNYKDKDRFVEIGIYDFGRNGIVEKFGRKDLTLKSFFDPQEILPDDEGDGDYLSLRYAAHLGIKTFVSSVLCNGGYFCAESNGINGKKEIIEGDSHSLCQKDDIDFISGTHYKVVLPVGEKKGTRLLNPVQSSSVIEALSNYLDEPSIPIVSIKDVTDTVHYVEIDEKSTQIDLIKQICLEIISKIKSNNKNKEEERTNTCIAIDFKDCEFSPNALFKIISYLQLNMLGFDKIVLFNLSSSIVIEICSIIHNLCAKVTTKKQPIWSNENAVILIDYNHNTHVLCGETKSSFAYVNRQITAYSFGAKNEFYDFEDKGLKKASRDLLNRFVLPYDCLVGENARNVFLSYVDRILENPIEDNTLGCKVNTPTKIGSKLYIDHYYEADFLFQNSYFTDRFAFLISRKIKTKTKNSSNSVILIGYNPYSELLVERVRRFVHNDKGKKIVSVVAETNDETNGLRFLINGTLKKGIKYDIVTIVPIASSLTTHDKIISCFTQQMREYSFGAISNYCAVLVRDDYQNKKTGKEGVTVQEKAQKWKSVRGDVVSTYLPNAKRVSFLLAKSCGWHNLIDEKTFPINYWEEIYINQTKNSALNIKDFVKYPVAAIPPNKTNNNRIRNYYGFTEKRLNEMSDYIYFGHILHNEDHHRYFFDIRRYLENFENKTEQEKKNTQLFKWASNFLKNQNEVYLSNCFNVLVTSDPDSDPHLTNFINKYLFEDNAYVLFLNINDYRQNIRVKHSFLKQFGRDGANGGPNDVVYFHFVDQALVTGRSYQKAKSYMASILENPGFRFYSVITIINRLSKDKYEEISAGLVQEGYTNNSRVYSYNHFFILPSKMQDAECSLCKLKNYFEKLKTHSVIRDCRIVIDVNKNKYKDQLFQQCSANEVGDKGLQRVSDDIRYWKRMVWRDKLFYEISLISGYESANKPIDEQRKEIEDRLNFLYTKCKSIDDKIPFLKAISYPPLSEYVRMRKYAFELMLRELRNVIEKEKPQIYDLFLLKVLLKHLAMLGSNALVRRDVIIGSMRLYYLVRSQLIDEVVQLKKTLTAINDEKINQEKIVRKKGNDQLELQFDNNANSLIQMEDSIKTKLNYICEYIGLNDACEIDNNEIIKHIEGDNKLNNFYSSLHFYIKLATHKEEARSLWLGELLRTGLEIKSKKYNANFKASKTRLYNCLFKDYIRYPDFCKKLLPHLFFDNTTIIRKTLDDFEKELKNNDSLKPYFYDKNEDLLPLNSQNQSDTIIEIFREIIENKHYYSWFKHFLKEEDGAVMDESIDNLPLIQKYIQVLYARLVLQEFLNPDHSNRETFYKNAERLLVVFCRIMNAQSAFIVIKPRGSEMLYTLATYHLGKKIDYDKCYCKELLYEKDDVEKGRPFVVRKDITINGEYYDGLYNRAAFLMLNLVETYSKSDDKTSDVLVGTVGFLYDDKGSNNRFMIEKQELGRLLLLLKPETDLYVKHVADEMQFEVWKERQYTSTMLQKINYKSGHRFILNDSDFRLLDDDEYYKIFKEFYTMSNVVVSFVFSLIVAGKELKFSKSDYFLTQVFDNRFTSVLHKLNQNKWDGLFDEKISICHDVQISINLFVFQSFIVQCLNNVVNHSGVNNDRFGIVFFSNRMEIQNSVVFPPQEFCDKKKEFEKKYDIETINENILSHNMEGYGLTIVSFIKYCESVKLKCVPMFIDGDCPGFKVTVYF